MSASSGQRTAAPWDLSFLRIGALVALAATAVAAPLVGLVLGWGDALAVVVGAAVVTAFFCVSGLVVAWAGKVDDTWTLPAALLAFGVKALLLFPLLTGLPPDGWLDRVTLGWTVVAGALLWSGLQLRWVWTRQLYYVPPPAPPEVPGNDRATDPDRPRTRD
ncbi:hypothetical protein [Modestobacter lapidis]|nr:hypothetical protein [Modestobacter lapidis]